VRVPRCFASPTVACNRSLLQAGKSCLQSASVSRRNKLLFLCKPWIGARSVEYADSAPATPETHQWFILLWQIENMRRQEQLRAQQQFAYRSGDMREVSRIAALLEPET